jgi:hypothetical protein
MSEILWDIINNIKEIHSLIPDSILFGSLLMYLLTHNISFGIFGIFIFELALSHRLISWLFSQSAGPSRPTDLSCRVGFKTTQYRFDRIFKHDPYPSYGVFSIASIATYLGLAINEFSNTLNSMGPEWSSRTKVAYSFIGIFLLAVIIGRWLSGCEPKLEIVIAFLCAMLIGYLFYYVNRSLFGVESMNFLGLPYLVSKESKGSPIYVCSVNDTNSSQ